FFVTCTVIVEMEILNTIYKPLNICGGPLYRINMKLGFGRFYLFLGRLLGANGVVIGFSMYRGVDPSGIVSHIFHDIDLSVERPLKRCLLRKHPECRPCTLSSRYP